MYIYVKRFLDLLLVLITTPIWLPVGVILSVLVKLTSKGPVFFTQKRIGKNHIYFTIYKFRSMYTNTPKDVPTHLLQNSDTCITAIGRFLRRFSLDELPQIINIIKGELSIIGPRPALWNQDDLIAEREKYSANNIPVGLTGLAQVKGRDELSIKEKAAYDGEYAKKMGFILDVWILYKTAANVLLSRGVKEGGPGR